MRARDGLERPIPVFLKIAPDLFEARYAWGCLLQETERIPEAIAAFERVLGLEPEEPETAPEPKRIALEPSAPQ